MEDSKTLLVIPTYNECLNIEPLLDRVFEAVAHMHVLFVDDNSSDGTQDKIAQYTSKSGKSISILGRQGKLGLGGAYRAGFRWGLERGYDQFIQMDADLSHDPKYLLSFLDYLKASPVVVGSRYVPGGGTVNWGVIRQLISRGGSLYSRLMLGMSSRDLTGGFNGWHKDVLDTIDLATIHSEGYCFQVEMKYRAFRAGYAIREFPIVFKERVAGSSKMSFAIVLEAVFKVCRLRFSINSNRKECEACLKNENK